MYLHWLVLGIFPDETLGWGAGRVGHVAIGYVGGARWVQVAVRIFSWCQHHTDLSQKPALKLVLE